jgi:Glycosyl hydrolases family 31
MFGPDLLAAPVITPGARTRSVWLPRGRWVDVWRALTFVTKDGSLTMRRPPARVLRGGRSVKLRAPLAELPLLARAGTVLPLLPADVDTLTPYGKARGLVHLADRAGRMTLLAFPRGRSKAEIGEGESVRSRETARGWRLTIRGKRARRYSLQASMATLARPVRVRSVTLDGSKLPRRAWSYDPKSRVLRADFKTRSGALTVK